MGYSRRKRHETVRMVRETGCTLRRAEAETGVSRQTVHRWCREAGVRFHPGWIGGAVADRRPGGGAPSRLGLEQRLAIA